ncbi:hypothetical protein LOK49_LG15G00602 [Camellia lanceoleosa]|uniref:Uncharacterized protein n=1 Tax=Camellia lanceoleosa TaxID=1840588 RepID=A0ACC0F215_9ERIC|nr:hypothetical protein LOK49_LG15G00602 [Camellia lanceoleosa]
MLAAFLGDKSAWRRAWRCFWFLVNHCRLRGAAAAITTTMSRRQLSTIEKHFSSFKGFLLDGGDYSPPKAGQKVKGGRLPTDKPKAADSGGCAGAPNVKVIKDVEVAIPKSCAEIIESVTHAQIAAVSKTDLGNPA